MQRRSVKHISKAIGLQSRAGDVAMFKSVKLRQALRKVLDAAVAVTRAQYGSLQLLHPSDGSLRIVAHHGFSDEALQFFRVVRDDGSIPCRRGKAKRALRSVACGGKATDS